MRMTAASLALAMTIALQADVAGAQTSVAVLGVEAVDAPMSMANLLAVALQNRVRRMTGYNLVAGKELEEIKLVFGCVDEKPACMATAGQSLNATRLIWGVLKRSGSGYRFTVNWLDVTRARLDNSVSEDIDRPELTRAQATALVARVTRSFLVTSAGRVKVSCSVEGAQVSLGARAVATTRKGGVVLEDVTAGTHLVRIEKGGYEPWTQQVLVEPGETTDVDARLVPTALGEDGSAPPERSSADPNAGWKVAFWSSAALTLGLATGIGISGWQVLEAESDKEEAIRRYVSEDCDTPGCKKTFEGPDACTAAEELGVDSVAGPCDRGSKYAVVTNVFIAATAAVAVLTGYLYYKAFVAVPAADTKPPDPGASASSLTWMLSPSVSPDGAGLGLSLQF